PNVPELLEAHYGVPASGGVLVAINTRLTASEVDEILRSSRARILVLHPSLRGSVDPIRERFPDLRIIEIGHQYEAFLAAARDGEPEDRLVDEDDTISVNYTSGTTGQPKGVMYTHRGAYLNALAEAHHAGLDCRSRYLWTLPMFHCNGWCYTWAVTGA